MLEFEINICMLNYFVWLVIKARLLFQVLITIGIECESLKLIFICYFINIIAAFGVIGGQ